MRKILLLRVGIDSGCGGTLGPIFPDGTFEYVPIPESPQCVSARSLYFRDLPARHGGRLAQYVPTRYREAAAHYDPEFQTFTYGDPTRNKRAQLLRLNNGDLLVFYAGLRPVGSQAASRLYIIGYFTVASVESIESAKPWPPPSASRFWGNAHLRRSRADHGLVVVCGHSRASRLLERAIMISDETQHATAETEKRLGIRGSLMRAIGRWVPSGHIVDALEWIAQSGGVAVVHETQMRTLIYKRTHSGDPCPRAGVFGNHNCMGSVRGWCYDAVIGVGGIGRECCKGIAGKLTWVGIGPKKKGDARCPKVTFDHFVHYGEKGKDLLTEFPLLARRIYGGRVRLIMSTSLSEEERREVKKIIDRAKKKPPSGQNAEKTSGQHQSTCPCINSAARKAEQQKTQQR